MRPALLLLALSPLASAQSVWVVDQAGGGDFSEIQPALDASADGDTILVKQGDYAGFEVQAREVHIVAEVGAEVNVVVPQPTSGVWVEALAPGQQVLLSGIRSHHFALGDDPGFGAPDLSRGVVLVDRVPPPDFGSMNVWCSLVVRKQRHAVVNDCTLHAPYPGDGDPPPSGDPALRVFDEQQRVFVYDSSLVGADGGDQSGGFGCPGGGDGGDGLLLESGATFTLRGERLRGEPGIDACGTPGLPGLPLHVVPPAVHTDLAQPLGLLKTPRLTRENTTVDLRIWGPPGTPVVLLDSPRLRPDRYLGPTVGALHLKSPLTFSPAGTIPASGLLVVPWSPGTLPAGVESEPHFLQAMLVQSGSRYLSNVASLVVIDDAY